MQPKILVEIGERVGGLALVDVNPREVEGETRPLIGTPFDRRAIGGHRAVILLELREQVAELLVDLAGLRDDRLAFDKGPVILQEVRMIEDLESGAIWGDGFVRSVGGFQVAGKIEIELLGKGRVVLDEIGLREDLLDAGAEFLHLAEAFVQPGGEEPGHVVVGIELESRLDLRESVARPIEHEEDRRLGTKRFGGLRIELRRLLECEKCLDELVVVLAQQTVGVAIERLALIALLGGGGRTGVELRSVIGLPERGSAGDQEGQDRKDTGHGESFPLELGAILLRRRHCQDRSDCRSPVR